MTTSSTTALRDSPDGAIRAVFAETSRAWPDGEGRLADLDRRRLRAAMGAEAFEAEYAAGRALDLAHMAHQALHGMQAHAPIRWLANRTPPYRVNRFVHCGQHAAMLADMAGRLGKSAFTESTTPASAVPLDRAAAKQCLAAAANPS